MLFSSFDFCVQLVWIIIHKVCDVVCSCEKKKTMFATDFFIPKWCQYCYIFEYEKSQNF
jgi:hypothetical protein